jgi:HD containing hydrolase-like enzyme
VKKPTSKKDTPAAPSATPAAPSAPDAPAALVDAHFLTQNGVSVSYASIAHGGFLLDDVAHGLSNINRFGGASTNPLSVAQHSVMVSVFCQRRAAVVFASSPDPARQMYLSAAYGLFHDCAALITSDIPSHYKTYIEARTGVSLELMDLELRDRFFARFGLPPLSPHHGDILVAVDAAVGAEERRQLFPRASPAFPGSPASEALNVQIRAQTAAAAKQSFTERFWYLHRLINFRL